MSIKVSRVGRSTSSPHASSLPVRKDALSKKKRDVRYQASNLTNLVNHFENLTEGVSLSDTSISYVGLMALSEGLIITDVTIESVVSDATGPIFVSPKRPYQFFSPLRKSGWL